MPVSRNITTNPPGFVPIYGQGLLAKETQLGAIGTKAWLKSIKLHKYWPLVSNWSYWQMLYLTEDNMDYYLTLVRGTGITKGARGKLLRSVQELRDRQNKLTSLVENLLSGKTPLGPVLTYLLKVLYTPMPTSEGELLPVVIIESLMRVREYTCVTRISNLDQKKVEKILWECKANSVLNRAEVSLRHSTLLRTISTSYTFDPCPSIESINVLQKRRRNVSGDSGFEDKPFEEYLPFDILPIWPAGVNSVMFDCHDETKYNALLKRSPFYSSSHTETSEDKIVEVEEQISNMLNNLLI